MSDVQSRLERMGWQRRQDLDRYGLEAWQDPEGHLHFAEVGRGPVSQRAITEEGRG